MKLILKELNIELIEDLIEIVRHLLRIEKALIVKDSNKLLEEFWVTPLEDLAKTLNALLPDTRKLFQDSFDLLSVGKAEAIEELVEGIEEEKNDA